MNMQETEEAVVLSPESKAGAAVIWLHGLGADGYDFVSIVPELGLPKDLPVRFIFPHAPARPVTINGGMRMRAWYDILSLERPAQQDEAGIHDSERIVHNYVQRELDAGVPASKIVLAGFSQGGAIVLHTGLRYPQKLGGIMALSTYMPLADKFSVDTHAVNRDVPILMCHGQFDLVLPLALGEQSRKLLEAAGCRVQWHEYPMQHQVCMEEVEEMGRWLTARLS